MLFFRPGVTLFPPDSRECGRGLEETRFERVELDLANDQHARAAMEAYADSCETELPWLGDALRRSRFGHADRLTQCAPTALRVFRLAHAEAARQSDYSQAAWDHVLAQLTAVLFAPPPDNASADSHASVMKLHV